MGVWIETWRDELKQKQDEVTPFVGVWIETQQSSKRSKQVAVTPFVGVWIETAVMCIAAAIAMSHPSWVCGLKQKVRYEYRNPKSHTLRGCVD